MTKLPSLERALKIDQVGMFVECLVGYFNTKLTRRQERWYGQKLQIACPKRRVLSVI